MEKPFTLPYTICFCLQNEHVLMLYRYKQPNQYLWNGIGGKIEVGEKPTASIKRELLEETGIDITIATTFYYAGIVSWEREDKPGNNGMYTFIADLPSEYPLLSRREISEGILAWKPLAWVCNKKNTYVVSNIPYFLPYILSYNIPLHYHCDYSNTLLQGVHTTSLDAQFLL